jgi:hypothetical protein
MAKIYNAVYDRGEWRGRVCSGGALGTNWMVLFDEVVLVVFRSFYETAILQ